MNGDYVGILVGAILSVVFIVALLKITKNDAGSARTSNNAATAISAMSPDERNNAIVSLLKQGRKIEAIKLYREQTGLGLKEAKDAVEQIERDLHL
jgi:large subunit ribosomal protein L7/L12